MNKRYLIDIYRNERPANSKMCAILYNKSKILSIGWSTPFPYVKIFEKILDVPAIHAEIEAIKKLLNNKKSFSKKRIKANLIVFKLNDKHEFSNSKPCKNCIKLIHSPLIYKNIHIKKILYYENGEFKKSNVNEIFNDHISYGWANYYNKK